MINYEDTDWQVRNELWDKYYKVDTNDWGVAKKESPLRGVEVCHRCGALVEDAWKHLDWHEKLEPGTEWNR